jgi:hypothetical protein
MQVGVEVGVGGIRTGVPVFLREGSSLLPVIPPFWRGAGAEHGFKGQMRHIEDISQRLRGSTWNQDAYREKEPFGNTSFQ